MGGGIAGGRRRIARRLLTAMVGALVLASGCSTAVPKQHAAAPRPLVVDTDMGSDDIVALLYLLSSPVVDVRAVTVAGTGLTHCGPGVAHLRELLSLAGRSGVPVACGRGEPLDGFRSFPRAWRDLTDSFYGLDLPPAPAARPAGSAVGLLSSTLRRAGSPVSVVALGPLTNLAEALGADPGLSEHVAGVTIMGGALRVPGNEVVHGTAEYNIWADARAASLVVSAGVPVTLVPLDASNDVPMTLFFRDALRAHRDTPQARVVGTLLRDPHYFAGTSYLWDPLAAVLAASPALAHYRTEHIRIVEAPGPDYGRTEVETSGPAVHIAVAPAVTEVQDQLLSTLAGEPVRLRMPPPVRWGFVTIEAGGCALSGLGGPLAPGRVAVRIRNVTGGRAFLTVVALPRGRTPAAARRVLASGHSTPPGWFRVGMTLAAPPWSDATWGADAVPATYGLLCSTADGTVHAIGRVVVAQR